jgi:hypothetical protein
MMMGLSMRESVRLQLRQDIKEFREAWKRAKAYIGTNVSELAIRRPSHIDMTETERAEVMKMAVAAIRRIQARELAQKLAEKTRMMNEDIWDVPTLENQRHELFAQELAKGKTAHEAYSLAGFKESRKNASRLRTKEDITARVAELQAVAARSAAITIESICAELDQANQVAKTKGQAAAMVSASALRAKLGGLMVERVEVGGPNAFEEAEDWEDLADKMLAECETRFHPVTEADREGLTALIKRQGDELGEFLAAINARPVNGLPVNPADIRARDMAAQRRPRRLLAGSNGRGGSA